MRALSFFDLKESTDPFAACKFSTNLLCPEDQFDAWRSPFAETIDLRPTAHASEMFETEFSCWAFEDIIFTRAIYADAPARRWQHLQRSFVGHWCVVLARSDDRSETRFPSPVRVTTASASPRWRRRSRAKLGIQKS